MAPKNGGIWEDREVLFDLPFNYLKLRLGEKIFERIEPVEDTKGNSGMKGRMVVTNLRIIWHSLSSPRINLSIGLNCIITITPRIVSSGLRGSTQAVCVLAAFMSNKYEFLFTNLRPKCLRHYSCLLNVHKSYTSTRLYRDLKMRGAIVHNKQLKLLLHEKILLNEHSIWNLSSDAGNLGTMIVTNIRVVWFADINPAFNVSMPYVTIDNVSIRDSKFGSALVIVIRPSSGGYVLGFRADPAERLRMLLQELVVLHKAYNDRPIFGVEFSWNDNQQQKRTETDVLDELEEIGEPRGEMGPNLYIASQLGMKDDGVVYTPYLGLAIQPLKDGFTLKSLFEVQSST